MGDNALQYDYVKRLHFIFWLKGFELSAEWFFKLKEFEIHTQIRQHVTLPFTNDQYRCVMFDGVFVRLVTDNDYIIGVNV